MDPAAGPPPAVLGDYDLLGELGRGGMGVVYEARQRSLGKRVALKTIRTDHLPSEAERQRFRNEAEIAAQLDHPNIVPIYEIGDRDGLLFFSMKLIEGPSLAEALPQFRDDPRASACLVVVLARAVQHAHERGVLHRDLKPANVLLYEAVPFVSDFGLARRIGQDTGLTQTGAIVGTPSYMAPEQASGRRDLVTTATDVYGLGAILYTLLTGRPPFQAATVLETLALAVASEPTPPSASNPRVPLDLQTVCLKCLHKDPAKRYAGAGELAEDLERWLQGEPIRARRIGPAERAFKWVRRRPVEAALAGLVVLVAALGFGAALDQFLQASSARVEAADRADREAEAKDQARGALARAEGELYFASLALAELRWRDDDLDGFRQALSRCPPGLRRWEWHHLHRRDRAERLTLVGHQRGASTLAFSPDGERLAGALQGGVVRVWAAQDGEPLLTLTGHGEKIGGLAWSPDGGRLFVGSSDRHVRSWSIGGDPKAVVLGPHEGTVWSVSHHPKRPLLAVGVGAKGRPDAAGAVVVWDLTSGKPVRTLTGHEGAVYAVAYSPDGSRLASGSRDETAAVWDAETGRRLLTLAGHRQAADPAGSRFAPIRDARGVEGGFTLLRGTVFGVAFSPDGRLLGTASGDHTVKLWEASSGKELRTLRGHRRAVGPLAFSPDGGTVASGSEDWTARSWDVATGREARRYLGHLGDVCSVAFGPRRTGGPARLATGSADGTVKLWDSDQGQEGYRWTGHGATVFGLAFSPDGKTFAAGTGDLFNPSRPGKLRLFDLGGRREMSQLPGHETGIACLAFGPGGKLLASGGADGTVKVWDPSAGKELRQLRVSKGMAFGVAFSPDGSSLAACNGSLLLGSQPGEVKVWDLATGKEKQTFAGHEGAIHCLAYSPDGTRLATGGSDRAVRIWDVASGAQVRTLIGLSGVVLGLAWSPDGRRLVAGGGALGPMNSVGEALVWEVDTGAEVQRLKGDPAVVTGVAFTPDGQRVLTSGRDPNVRVWEAGTGRLALTLLPTTTFLSSLAVSPDGRWVAAGDWTGGVTLWEGPAAPQE